MCTPRLLLFWLRLAALLAAVVLAVAALGPFQGPEGVAGFSGEQTGLFFVVTVFLFAIAPSWRRTDLGLIALASALLMELGQGALGHGMSLKDLGASAVGVGAAMTPVFIERLRHLTRKYPDVDFYTLWSLDRRRAPRVRSGEMTIISPVRPRTRRSGPEKG